MLRAGSFDASSASAITERKTRSEDLSRVNDRYVAYVLECLIRDSFSPLLYSLPLDQRTNRAERFLSPGQRRTHSPGKNCAQGALSLSEDGVHDAPAQDRDL